MKFKTYFTLGSRATTFKGDIFRDVVTIDGSKVKIMDRGTFDRAVDKADQKLNEVLREKDGGGSHDDRRLHKAG